LKLLTHKLKATEGEVIHHPAFKIAYFGQHSTAELNMETNAIEFMMQAFPKANPAYLRDHLAKTGIVGNVADTRVEGLSYSQRSCIIFAKLTYKAPHLLILDEPTNFLDLESVDSLIGACNKYKGALLLVSHNRDFLKKCATQYLSIVPGRFELYNDMKTAEKATYTFIAEMEEGVSIGRDALANNPGGGTVHSSQKVGAASDATKTDSSSASAAESTTTTATTTTTVADAPAVATKVVVAVPVADGADLSFVVGDTCQAKYSRDGRWYKAIIKAIKDDAYTVTYSEYGNTETVSFVSSIRTFVPPAARNNNNNNKGGKSHNNNANKKVVGH